MKVLLVTDFFLPVVGGLEVHVDALATALVEAGMEVHVATLTSTPLPTHPGVRVHPIAAFGIRRMPHRDGSRPFAPPCPEPTARRALAAVVREVAPDVIHGHSWLAMSLPADTGAPLVYTAHDYGMVCHLKTLWRWPGQVCEGPSLLKCIRCGAKEAPVWTSTSMTIGLRAGRKMLLPSAVIAVTDSVRKAIEAHVSAPIRVISSYMAHHPREGPDPGMSSADGAGTPTRPLVMYAGDPGEHKGVDDLIALWRSPNPPKADLVLAFTRSDHRQLPARVHVVYLPPSEMMAAWRRASIAVVPSRWAEPLGITALEAMTAGLPVIVTDVGGLGELVEDGVNGLRVAPSNATSLRRALDQLIADPALRHRIGAAARAAVSRYSAPEQAARIVEVYRSVLEGYECRRK